MLHKVFVEQVALLFGEADNEDESDEDEGDKMVREMEKKVKNK